MSAIFAVERQKELLQSYLSKIDEGKPCPFDDLPNELKGYLFNLLTSDSRDVASLSLACRQLYVIAKMALPSISEKAFGKAAWERHFEVDVGEEPPLPPNILRILQSPCPYWEGRRTGETHDLLLIPETINEKPLTAEVLSQIAQQKEDYKLKFHRHDVNDAIASLDVPTSYWALITKNVLPNSRDKNYSEQQSVLESSYAVPTTLEMAAKTLTCCAQLMVSDLGGYATRCQEAADSLSTSRLVAISGTHNFKLSPFEDSKPNHMCGMVGVRRFT